MFDMENLWNFTCVKVRLVSDYLSVAINLRLTSAESAPLSIMCLTSFKSVRIFVYAVKLKKCHLCK